MPASTQSEDINALKYTKRKISAPNPIKVTPSALFVMQTKGPI